MSCIFTDFSLFVLWKLIHLAQDTVGFINIETIFSFLNFVFIHIHPIAFLFSKIHVKIDYVSYNSGKAYFTK